MKSIRILCILALSMLNYRTCCPTIISEVQEPQPISLSHCFIQLIHDNKIRATKSDSILPLIFEETTTLSYTIQQLEYFNLLPELNDTVFDTKNDVKLGSQSGFFRFIFRLSNSCITFLIKTSTFNETIQAIQNSGHGTSDNVLFIIETSPLTDVNEVIYGFKNTLLNSEGPPFHAPLAFFNPETNEIAIFCYFCSPSKILLLIVAPTTWNTLQNQHFQINSNGYGNVVIILDTFRHTTEAEENCFVHYDSRRTRTNLFGEHVNCTIAEAWLRASTQLKLNISFKFNTMITEEHLSHNWMLQVRIGEGLYLRIPNEYIYTRGSLIIADELVLDWMGCLEANKLQSFKFSIISVLDLTSSCILIHSPIFALRFHVAEHLERVRLADSMQLSEFPSFKSLVKKGYRFWVVKKEFTVGFIKSFSSWTRSRLGSHIGGDPTDPRYYFAGEGHQNMVSYYNNTLSLFEAAAKYKLLITSLSFPETLKMIGQQLVSVNRNLICKVDQTSREVELTFDFTFRVWGYLSRECSKVLAILLSSGDFARLTKLNKASRGRDITNLRLTKVSTFIEPKPISLTSAVGVCCWICFGVGGFLFVWWSICMFKFWRRIIRNKVMYLRERLFPKSRVPKVNWINVRSN
ncbi:unnamed protein product [Orchesella dallaii]|uniref:Glycoprotein n=1 Tax=Orchesella dallaii TaxID=48710 RepID=A0ABP1PI11_9HEXA